MEDSRPVVMFGLDGADPELVERWIEDLPNFKRLKKEGFFGELQSIHPPITTPAWMCMISGKKPERFGPCEVMMPDFKNYDFEPVDSSFFQGETLLDRSENVIGFGVPGATPIYPVDGWMVTGLKFLDPEFYPESLEDELMANTDLDAEKKNWETPLEERVEAFIWLLRNKEFGRAFGVFQLIDVAMHNTANEATLKPYYERCDTALGEIMDLCEKENWNLIVTSDHGSTTMERSLFLNGWLREHGYTEYTEAIEQQTESPVYSIGKSLLRIGRLKPLISKIADLAEKYTGREWAPTSSTVIDNIDFGNSEAFSYMTSGMNFGAIWIHDDERWPRGTVPSEKKGEKAQEIKQELEKEELVAEVHFDSDRLKNHLFPDLLVEGKDNVGVGAQTYPYISHKSEAAIHHKKGLIAGKGPGFTSTDNVSAHITDVSPTIEALEGTVRPYDGEPITDILKEKEFSYESEEIEDVDF